MAVCDIVTSEIIIPLHNISLVVNNSNDGKIVNVYVLFSTFLAELKNQP